MSKATKRQRQMYVGKQELMMYFEDIAINVFKWDGLPENIYSFYPEQTLYRQGMACMIQIPGTEDYDIFPVAYGSMSLDLHGQPVSWRVYVLGNNPIADVIRNTVYTTENSVLIWNNASRTSLIKYVETQIDNMLRTDNTLKTNIMVQNTPVVIRANNKNVITAKNMFEMFEMEPVVYPTNETMEEISLEAIALNVAFIGDKLSDQYETYSNRILRYLGVNHLPVEKQERMLTGEVDSNDNLIDSILQSRLALRQQAADNMNKLFGLNVTVDTLANVNEQRDLERMQSTLGDRGQSGEAGEGNGSTTE